MMSDRVTLIQPLVTKAVNALVLKRLTNHVALIKEGDRPSDKRKIDIKIALLVVHIINPFEDFFAAEEALIRGIDRDTLRKRKDEGRRDAHLALKKL